MGLIGERLRESHTPCFFGGEQCFPTLPTHLGGGPRVPARKIDLKKKKKKRAPVPPPFWWGVVPPGFFQGKHSPRKNPPLCHLCPPTKRFVSPPTKPPPPNPLFPTPAENMRKKKGVGETNLPKIRGLKKKTGGVGWLPGGDSWRGGTQERKKRKVKNEKKTNFSIWENNIPQMVWGEGKGEIRGLSHPPNIKKKNSIGGTAPKGGRTPSGGCPPHR